MRVATRSWPYRDCRHRIGRPVNARTGRSGVCPRTGRGNPNPDRHGGEYKCSNVSSAAATTGLPPGAASRRQSGPPGTRWRPTTAGSGATARPTTARRRRTADDRTDGRRRTAADDAPTRAVATRQRRRDRLRAGDRARAPARRVRRRQLGRELLRLARRRRRRRAADLAARRRRRGGRPDGAPRPTTRRTNAEEIGVGGGIALVDRADDRLLRGRLRRRPHVALRRRAARASARGSIGLIVTVALALAAVDRSATSTTCSSSSTCRRCRSATRRSPPAALIALAAIVLGSLLAAMAGGKVGERYHKRVDRAGLRRLNGWPGRARITSRPAG